MLSAPHSLISRGHSLHISGINSILLSTLIFFLLRNQMA